MKLGQNFVKYFVSFLVNGVKKNGFEIYWPLGSIMAEWILQIDWRIEKCNADFFVGGFESLRLDVFRHYNVLSWNACYVLSIGQDVSHPLLKNFFEGQLAW